MSQPLSDSAELVTDLPACGSGAQPTVGRHDGPADSDGTTPSDACPRCGNKLVNPTGLGWCTKCGYCRTLEEEKNKVQQLQPPPAAPSPLGVVEFVQLLGKVPNWAWVLLSGCLLIVALAFVADRYLLLNPLHRAILSSAVLGGSLLLMIVANLWLLLLLAAEDERLGPRDVLISVRLWKAALRRLPSTRHPVWIGSWSLTAGLCAVLVTGGLDYWFQFYRPKKLAQKKLTSAAVLLAQEEQMTMAEAIKQIEEQAGELQKAREEQKKQDDRIDRRPTVECVILAYHKGEGDVPAGTGTAS